MMTNSPPTNPPDYNHDAEFDALFFTDPMSIEQLKQAAAVMTAASNGEQIEFRARSSDNFIALTGDPSWNWSVFEYRVVAKPTKPREIFVNEYRDGHGRRLGGTYYSNEGCAGLHAVHNHLRVIRFIEDPTYNQANK